MLINITCFLLCSIVYMIFMKMQIGNKYLNFCGKISWGIYLTHRIMLRICSSLTGVNAFVWMMILLGGTIGMATIVTVISNLLVRGKRTGIKNEAGYKLEKTLLQIWLWR